MTGAIAIDKVSKRFPLPGNKDGVLALSELSLDIAPGEFVAILGPSGCAWHPTRRASRPCAAY